MQKAMLKIHHFMMTLMPVAIICLLEVIYMHYTYLDGEKTIMVCFCSYPPRSVFCPVMLVAEIGFPFPSSIALTPTHM